MPLVGGLLPMSVVLPIVRRRRPPADARRRAHRPGRGRRRLRAAAPQDRQAGEDDQVRGQAGAQAERGRPALKGASAPGQLAAAAQPDDGRRRRGRRGAGQPDARRGRAEATSRPRAPRGWSPRAPARWPPGSASSPRRTGCAMVAGRAAGPGAARQPARSARRSRPSSSTRSPRCWRSSQPRAARRVGRPPPTAPRRPPLPSAAAGRAPGATGAARSPQVRLPGGR